MEVRIRREEEKDYKTIFELVELAFANLEISDQTEQFLVNRLREGKTYIPELSLVAEAEGQIVGHILFTKIHIENGEQKHDSLSLAPVCVHPDFQNKGIGTILINAGHEIATQLGFKSVMLVGHENYYPRFGYKIASEYGINFSFEAPDINCMACELVEGELARICGNVVYPPEFY